jgi:hypothetical protein
VIFTPKLTVSYEPTQGFMTYATASRGFLSGGLNAQGCIDNRLQVNIAAFLDRGGGGLPMGMADPRRVLFGSDYPFIPTSRGTDYLARAGLSRKDLFAIERGNALSLLPRLSGS